jgi:hypothetical protein
MKALLYILALTFSINSFAQYTGFQRSLNDKPWGINSVTRDNGKVFRGERSERFEVRQGDCGAQPNWSDCNTDRERAEMSELRPYTELGAPTWYSWSVYFDETWPDISPVTTTVGQFHQRDKSSPAILFVQRNNKYMMRIESAKQLYPNNDIFILLDSNELRGKWHTVVVFAKWSTEQDGELRVWINGQLKVNVRGPNTVNTTPVYFKYGIYRSFVSRVPNRPAHILYIDEVRKGPTRESVDPFLNRNGPVN